MKKLIIILAIILSIAGGFVGYKVVSNNIENKKIAKIKEGWHVEVITDYITVRKEANRNSAKLGEVKKGSVYEVLDMESNNNNFWYKVEYDKDEYGWIANPLNSEYLKDVNNPNDIMAPTIRFYDAIYYCDSIDDINYDHIDVTDDREGVTVTHKVFHEVNESEGIDQYWIQYFATDAVGKTSEKVQKIEFNNRPSESEVYPFSAMEH